GGSKPWRRTNERGTWTQWCGCASTSSTSRIERLPLCERTPPALARRWCRGTVRMPGTGRARSSSCSW
ncbi:unnamed protein product, partial [Ectocarpus sp. 13 AM-2016]